jgi:hypothetical protein
VSRSVDAYFDMDSSVIIDDYSLNDDLDQPFEVIAKFFYLPDQFDPDIDKRFEILTEDDLGM